MDHPSPGAERGDSKQRSPLKLNKEEHLEIREKLKQFLKIDTGNRFPDHNRINSISAPLKSV